MTRSNLAVARQKWVAPIFDCSSWIVAIALNTFVRFDILSARAPDFVRELDGIALAVALQLLLGYFLIYRNRWRVGSFEELVTVGSTILGVGVGLMIASAIFLRSGVSFGDVLSSTFFALVFVATGRAMYRFAVTPTRRDNDQSLRRTIIFGVGSAGIQVIESLTQPNSSDLVPVVLLDDNPAKRHLRVRHLTVEGTRADIVEIAKRYNAAVVLIAISNVRSDDIAEVTNFAREAGLEVRVLPPVAELLSGVIHVEDIRPLTIEDLLGRREVAINFDAVANILEGKRVLVTGAGGSIGSELCRQIAKFFPERLIMLDRNESGLFETQLSLEGRALLESPDLVLGNIRDHAKMERVFAEHRPEIVFHAAALKHLTLLEQWPGEAVKTNVKGTAFLLTLAQQFGVGTFVNISTDKAANPISVLGYSKRITERLTASVREGTYISVRFGNVLGSQGSFLRAFRSQVASGGPITVTDPEVMRYFMTVAEAVQLTLQAAALGSKGDILVLDMGEPISINEIAKKLAAEAPRPVDIVYTGLRPGEKLREDLFDDGDHHPRDVHPLVRACSADPLNIERCHDLPECDDLDVTVAALKALSLAPSDAESVQHLAS